MIIRKALDTEKDCNLVFSLSNDPLVRSVSFNQNKIEYSNHIKWYKNTVKNDNILFLLVFDDDTENNFIGQIRFNREEKTSNECIISLSITEKFRGKGIGNQFMQSGIEMLHNQWKDIKTIIAEVKADNMASNKLFIKEGFELKSSVNTYKKEI